ncbi:hypothetical protein BRADI_1g59902v3 [Brachypodium distachyon]|uniref:Uncharacterized protein n=1 Tax=Brachypodium distachyon TaxID=15368 RepID=A0A2K2DSJ0_BRADI|nr:hypothetical protein BRADI_1g59902v3 [Brachypodium distachyon]
MGSGRLKAAQGGRGWGVRWRRPDRSWQVWRRRKEDEERQLFFHMRFSPFRERGLGSLHTRKRTENLGKFPKILGIGNGIGNVLVNFGLF